MNNSTPMLIKKISEYIDDTKKLDVLYKQYNNFDLREFFDFQDNTIPKRTLQRGLLTLKGIFSLQLIINKNIYFPGVGMFTITPGEYSKNYSFPNTLMKMSQTAGKQWKLRKLIHDDMINKIIHDNKIDFERLDNQSFQLRKIGSDNFAIYTNLETKVNYLNITIKEFLKIEKLLTTDEIAIVHRTLYQGGTTFKDIVEDYKITEEQSFHTFIESIITDKVGMNMKILEDILVLIGYIENNLKEFGLEK